MESPCNTCDEHKKGRDKNHPDCVGCGPRIQYAVKQGMIHPEVLERKDDPVVVEAQKAVIPKMIAPKKKKRKICKDCKRRPVKCKELCNACYGRAWYRKEHEKVGPYRRKGVERGND